MYFTNSFIYCTLNKNEKGNHFPEVVFCNFKGRESYEKMEKSNESHRANYLHLGIFTRRHLD